MITFVVGYKNLLNVRRKTTEDFFEMMEEHLNMNRSLECIVADYGSDDGIKEFLESYKSIHLPVEPYPDQYLNLPKCYNAAVINSKNNIIASVGADMRFDQKLINGVIELFKILGEIILRVSCIKLNKEGRPSGHSFSPYFLYKENIIKSGGYDERLIGWGNFRRYILKTLKEDDDVMERIFKYQGTLEIRVRNLQYFHVWHDDTFRKQYDNKDLSKNRNAQIMIENINNNGENMINSYWKIDK